MSSVPRMRGRRFLRPALKKSSRKEREPSNAASCPTTEVADPSHVTSSVLNAIDHLGNQRFVLPPFADHFERWLKDLHSLLNEFETQAPQAVDESLRKEITESMREIHLTLAERTKVESTQSHESNELQQQLARCDAELSQLEHTHRMQTQELRKKYEKSSQEIREEIDQLDRRRIEILRKNANIFRRIFRKSDNSIAGTSIALDFRRTRLKDSEQKLQNELQKRQEDYVANRQKLITEIDSLRRKIREATETAGYDALKERREVCQRIHTAITSATQRTQRNEGSLTSDS